VQALAASLPTPAARVIVLGGESSRTPWLQWLAPLAATVDVMPAVRLEPKAWSQADVDDLHACRARAQPFAWVLTSVQAVHWLEEQLGHAGQVLAQWAKGQSAAAIHTVIAQELRECGWRQVESLEPGESALVAWASGLGERRSAGPT
jgi:uroporphyrinogen-III synthase